MEKSRTAINLYVIVEMCGGPKVVKGYTGIALSTISYWKYGTHTPSQRNIDAVLDLASGRAGVAIEPADLLLAEPLFLERLRNGIEPPESGGSVHDAHTGNPDLFFGTQGDGAMLLPLKRTFAMFVLGRYREQGYKERVAIHFLRGVSVDSAKGGMKIEYFGYGRSDQGWVGGIGYAASNTVSLHIPGRADNRAPIHIMIGAGVEPVPHYTGIMLMNNAYGGTLRVCSTRVILAECTVPDDQRLLVGRTVPEHWPEFARIVPFLRNKVKARGVAVDQPSRLYALDPSTVHNPVSAVVARIEGDPGFFS